MKRRSWTPQQKAAIVLEGLQGKPVADICLEYQITQSQYYQWRDQVLSNLPRLFELNQASKTEERLKRENAKLKTCVAELTLEVKKSEW
jgi:transposase-like protein